MPSDRTFPAPSSRARLCLRACLLALGLALTAMPFAHAATTVHFDDLNCDYDPSRPDSDYQVPAGYAGLIWQGLDCANHTMSDSGFGIYAGSGYADGAQSPRNLIAVPFTPPADPADGLSGAIVAPAGHVFDLHSLYMTPVWHDGLVVSITGYRNGVPIAPPTSVTLTATQQRFLNLQLQNVDRVEFASQAGSGTPHAPYFTVPFASAFVGRIFAMDTVSITLKSLAPATAVPSLSLPALMALSGLLGGMGIALSQRQRARKPQAKRPTPR